MLTKMKKTLGKQNVIVILDAFLIVVSFLLAL